MAKAKKAEQVNSDELLRRLNASLNREKSLLEQQARDAETIKALRQQLEIEMAKTSG